MSLIRHFLQFKDLRAEEFAYLFERTAAVKRRFKNYEKYTPLVDRTLAMIFEKASTRTRAPTRRTPQDQVLASTPSTAKSLFRDLSDRPRRLDHHPHCLSAELRAELAILPGHCSRHLPEST